MTATDTEPRFSSTTDGGTRCGACEPKGRFDAFVADLTKGKDTSRVRVVVER
ncbi:hypothetical protein [Thiococcus pfennigii]|uniref:hypothetical protein n=1 Tax=Thiococcus pfennigii TaxID=1057 RepID=UPI00190481CB|nr:hypothetical protein [Thiococcus pfennigii]